MTPETVFKPSTDPEVEPVFLFANPKPGVGEQDQYKQLICAELTRQGIPPAHLADRLRMTRPRLHKILKRTNPLTEGLRDRIFNELGIDHVRAKISVALLRDPDAYANQAVFLATESLKSFYLEVMTCRRGSIEVDLRPAIIHEAARRAYDLLLSHQERVMQNDQTLQA
ncbi:hypothetical protein [Novosphingobium aerophilum]|uniref:hypothetical protein n=1 Tax=Novosphingobium aerophilum TaxID=2839843 RepID=UPI001F3465D3|nr:hypothetical protein [Novosphingobium aerophilum]